MIEIQVLTRSECSACPDMLSHLEVALRRCGIQAHLETVDLGRLTKDDPLTGYGSPTVLIDGVDLFGMDRPRPAAPT